MASTGKARKPMKAWERYFKREVGGPGASTGEPKKAQERIFERDLGRPFVA